jgi:hypothetical protein
MPEDEQPECIAPSQGALNASIAGCERWLGAQKPLVYRETIILQRRSADSAYEKWSNLNNTHGKGHPNAK